MLALFFFCLSNPTEVGKYQRILCTSQTVFNGIFFLSLNNKYTVCRVLFYRRAMSAALRKSPGSVVNPSQRSSWNVSSGGGERKRLLTLVERGGAVYVSWDEGGLRLLPHSVVPHPPDAALHAEKSNHWSGLNMVPLLFKTSAPEDWVGSWVHNSILNLYTRFN